jgi:hypothetical protein
MFDYTMMRRTFGPKGDEILEVMVKIRDPSCVINIYQILLERFYKLR